MTTDAVIEAAEIRIDGRSFRLISDSMTAAQDDYLMGQLRLAGAIDVVALMGSQPSEKKAEELLTRILLSGRAPAILAGCLTEVGRKWTRKEADRNAEIFAEIIDPAEKHRMRTSIVGFVLGFFESGEGSSTTSPKSSSPNVEELDTESAAPEISGTSPQ